MGRRRSKKMKWPKPPKGHGLTRKAPCRHSVRAHKREGHPVQSYMRGKGDPRQIRQVKRTRFNGVSTTNRRFIYGDFDKDGTRNIDDVKPYDPEEKGTTEEILLSDEIQNIEKYREPFKGTTEDIAQDLEKRGYEIKHRVKTPYSIMNKLRRKYLGKIQDIGGCLILVDDKKDAYRAGEYLEEKYKILDKDDYYSKPKQGYEALHYTVLFEGKPHEIQIKTKKDYKKHLGWHTAYKKGEFKPSS